MKLPAKELLLPAGLFILAASALLSSFTRLGFVVQAPTLDMSKLDAIDIRCVASRAATALHVLPGLIFLLIGLVQFMPALRRHSLNLHRWLGRTFIVSITGPVTEFKQLLLAGLTRATLPLPIRPKSPINLPNS